MKDIDKRLIEDFLPIKEISAEASREKSVRKGHISTLHLWWARRPLVACRAAVYGALVPADRWVKDVNLKNPPSDPDKAARKSNGTKKGLNRSAARDFVTRLCKYPGSPAIIQEARRHILEAHAERLTRETGKKVTVEDIEVGRAPRPKVLDMFAGGGAIPLEALRLGCDAYALDLNPVAHIIEHCTLIYPQKYGKPDPALRGMTGQKNAKGETTWGGLASEVRYWGTCLLNKVKGEIGDLYPPIPDPEAKKISNNLSKALPGLDNTKKSGATKGFLTPVAYLWTRTVSCKNPNCLAIVPLVKQTWLCKKKDRYVALRVIAPRGRKQARFEVVEATTERNLGFDPEAGSKGGNATCPFCGTVADSDYVKVEGCAHRIGTQMMAIACTREGRKGKVYLSVDDVKNAVPDEEEIQRKIEKLCSRTGISVPTEKIINDAKSANFCVLYGLTTFGDLFTARQMLSLLHFTSEVRHLQQVVVAAGVSRDLMKAVVVVLASIVDRLADFNSSLCVFNYTGGRGVVHTFGRQALPMVWDFAETNPFNPAGASWTSGIDDVPEAFGDADFDYVGHVFRGSATTLPWGDSEFDAVITDPPYYDNVPYADISDFFYVWLRRSIGNLFPEHFAADATPKKQEAVADATRHGGSREKARKSYEEMMARSLSQASRVLKEGGEVVVVYAHKTTLGWATLVDALRSSGFTVTEAWPLETEKPGRLRAQDASALASSIFLIARKRGEAAVGNYENDVRSDLERIVRERVATLWEMGISGADLVIACVGAGLRAFTQFSRVEYANGDEVPAERFLAEVEGVVLESILSRLSEDLGAGEQTLAGVDPATRFCVLWRYTYGSADLDAGEAIVFANGTHVELDGHGGIATGSRALIEKKKSAYRLRDYTERGKDEKLGLPGENGQLVSLIDVLHRVLWLMEQRPAELPEFLRKANVNREQMRLVAQALAGPALKGGEMKDISPTGEQSALAKLLANWGGVVEHAGLTAAEVRAKKGGQQTLDFKKEERE
ncbi:MAG: DUF1156 domain-containing protein [Planctomycetes bacterium]|nr:DUF1156 domain-containing protein [Planctomycetota bacterium]